MFDPVEHYLSYGATDQETLRDLAGYYSGLIVPATVAAFQREGTGGFVLTLSATQAAPPYVIDPRFPLFQQALPDPKKSHEALAGLLGQPDLVREDEPEPTDFTDEAVSTIAKKWVEFNTTYGTKQQAKFDKYAKRLDEEVRVERAQGPEAILAPYLVSSSAEDPWWEISSSLYEETVEAAEETSLEALRVVACTDPGELGGLLAAIDDDRAVIWVSGLEELDLPRKELAAYGRAIESAHEREQQTFALYGGFFSVLLTQVGLAGACHGVGYGEHRNWPELPQSGPPPARYYLPRVHRYIGQDLAYQLWLRDPSLTACDCEICDGGSPVLDYHDLMKHSVLARQAEIEAWEGMALSDAAGQLAADKDKFEAELEAADLPRPLRAPAWRATHHLDRWIGALETLVEGEDD